MNVRPTQTLAFSLVSTSVSAGFAKMIALQEQVSSGKRVLRASDDPIGIGSALGLRQRLADVSRFIESAKAAKPNLDQAASLAEESSTLVSQARELAVSGLSGTLSDSDRKIVAKQIEAIRDQLLSLANTQSQGTYLFGGTSPNQPFVEDTVDGFKRVTYHGHDVSRSLEIGFGDSIETGLSGDEMFMQNDPSGISYAGVTGAKAGVGGSQGKGFEKLTVRHDATNGTLSAGIAFVASGANDTFIGDRTIEVDATLRRVRFGNGVWNSLGPAGDPALQDVHLRDENGGEIHLDFSNWTGAAATDVVNGAGSVSLDGTHFVAIAPGQTGLELTHDATNAVVHVDTTAIFRSGVDIVTFGGTSNLFDVLQGMADDLRNVDGMSLQDSQSNLSARLAELDGNHERLLTGLAKIGATSARVTDTQSRLESMDLQVRGMLSDVEDVDLSGAVVQLTRAEQTLQLAQATGAKLMQNTLLNYLR